MVLLDRAASQDKDLENGLILQAKELALDYAKELAQKAAEEKCWNRQIRRF